MNTFRRLFGTLQSRLLFTHMLVTVAVLFVATLIVLILQAPLRIENMVQRMTEWLQPTVTLARSNFADLAASSDGNGQTQFLDYLRSQADAQSARIFLVTQPDGNILFDSEDQLTGQTWQPGARRSFDIQPRRMRPGSMMPMMTEVTRGAASLNGADWYYVSTILLPLHDGSLDLVVLKPRPGLLGTMWGAVTELPSGILLGSLAALALAIFLLSRWTARAVTRSLAPLMAGTQALANGNLAYRVDTRNVSLVEVLALATDFNQMADRVQQSQQAQRDFIANVSHDLKTPLTSIQGYSQALLDGTAAGPKAQQHAALVINQESQRLTNVVEEVIDLARLESGGLSLHVAPFDADELCAEMVSSFHPHFEAVQVELIYAPASQPIMMVADATRLRRALANLLDNALKHTAPGGAVTLAVKALPQSGKVQYTVTDTGSGIPHDELERIWDRFYRVDRARTDRRGSGLGLSIVKEIVEIHGGTVGVESSEDQGSKFWFRIPIQQSDQSAPQTR